MNDTSSRSQVDKVHEVKVHEWHNDGVGWKEGISDLPEFQEGFQFHVGWVLGLPHSSWWSGLDLEGFFEFGSTQQKKNRLGL